MDELVKKRMKENEFGNFNGTNVVPFNWYAHQVGKKPLPKKKPNKWVNPKPKKKTKTEYLDEPNLEKEWDFYLQQVEKERLSNVPKKEGIALVGTRIKPKKK